MWMMVLDMIFSCCRGRLKDRNFDENGVDYRIKPSDCVGYGYFQTTFGGINLNENRIIVD